MTASAEMTLQMPELPAPAKLYQYLPHSFDQRRGMDENQRNAR